MRKAGWKRITGILFAAALLSGCAKQTYVEVTTAEETTVAATSAEIHIETATTEAEKVDPDQPPYYLPEERVEENGLIRSYPTGEMTDAAKANRRPIAVMMSNDKQALPQYGINRAGVVLSLIHISTWRAREIQALRRGTFMWLSPCKMALVTVDRE